MREVSFGELPTSDLIVDAVYQSDREAPRGYLGGEPLSKLMRVGNLGGFRSRKGKSGILFSALTSTGRELEWPDELDTTTGTYKYYGDNRIPGRSLLDTKQRGNLLLRDSFKLAESENPLERAQCPVFFIFEPADVARDQIFRGLAIPSAAPSKADFGLDIVTRTVDGQKFENYEAKFTILDEDLVSGNWLRDSIDEGKLLVEHPDVPRSWLVWVEQGEVHSRLRESTSADNADLGDNNLDQVLLRYLSSMQSLEVFENCVRRGLEFKGLEALFRKGERAAAERHVTRGRIRIMRLDADSPEAGIRFWTSLNKGNRIVQFLPTGEMVTCKILEKFINKDVGAAVGNTTEQNELGLLVLVSEPVSSLQGAETFENLAKSSALIDGGFSSISGAVFDALQYEILNEEVLGPDSAPNIPPEWAAALETADEYRQQVHRPEQQQLRKILFGNLDQLTCALCGKKYPSSFLVAGHIKKRAVANSRERADRAIVMPVCLFGCDQLFEQGLVSVADDGSFSVQVIPEMTDTVATLLDEVFVGKKCWWWRAHPETRKYFEYHHANVTERADVKTEM